MNAKPLLAVLLLSLGMSCSPIQIHSNSFSLSASDKVHLSAVTFKYEDWSKQEAEFIAKMKNNEAKWTTLLRASFDEAARGADMLDNSGVPVSITITDLNPGSQAGRYFLGGMGVGKGQILATADSPKGAITAGGELTGGTFGGSFDGILKALGRDVAAAIAERRQ